MKILIAEDDEMMRELLFSFITDLGHEVTTAENGQELVKYAMTDRPDLIVTDMHMPEMRGDSMIAMIDMYPPLAGIPVVMVTGATDGDLIDAGIPEGIPILHKPLDFEKLTAEIRKVSLRLGM